MLNNVQNELNSPRLKAEWLSIKLPFALFWLLFCSRIVIQLTSLHSNKGLCNLIECNLLTGAVAKYVLLFFILLFSVLYVLEKSMLITTFMLFALSFLVFSMHESFGISSRTGVITFVFLAQFIAYWLFTRNKNQKKLQHNRIFMPVQVIVTSYTLSGLSKVMTSGTSWFAESEKMVLQILKSNQMQLLDGHLLLQPTELLSDKINFILEYSVIVFILLLLALIIELTSFIGMLNKKLRLLWGVMLLLLHVGIYMLFEIAIGSFIVTMILFMINPFFIIYTSFQSLNRSKDAVNSSI